MPKLSQGAMDARRRHILQAAERCFAQSGFRSTTIADIRREAGVSTGAIYTHFPNKAAMIGALLAGARDERRAQLAGAVARGGGEAARALVLLEWTRAIFTAQGRHVAQIDVNLWAEALRDPSVGALARDALAQAHAAVRDVVASGLAAADVPHPVDRAAVASVLIAIFLGLEVQTAVGIKLKPQAITRALALLFADYLPEAAPPAPRKARAGRSGRKRAAR